MIKIIKNNELDKNTRYKIYATRCNCCNGKCLQELKKKIEDLEVENVEV